MDHLNSLHFHSNLATTEKRISKLSSALVDVEEEVSVLRDRLNKFTKEAAQIEINLKRANDTIASAESLVSKLDDEFHRWTKQVYLNLYINIFFMFLSIQCTFYF